MAPVVPQVIHHTPHIGILKAVGGILVHGLARAYRQYYRTACLVYSLSDHTQLVGMERTREVVDLDEVDTPRGVEVHDTVVVQLSILVVTDCKVIL